MSASRRAGLIVVGIAVVAGSWLRFASLGRLSPWDDEFPHMLAGRAVVADGRPALPSGRSYRRALAQTVSVGVAMKALGDDEAAARVPSALVGVATIAVVWLLARRRFGEAAAVAAAAAIALSPLHVAHARSARFYTAFALAYGAAAWFGARAIRTGRRGHVATAVALFALALHLQSLALFIVVPLAADAWICRRSAIPDERRRATLALQALGAVVAAGGVAFGALALAGKADGLIRAVRLPVPGVELAPAVRLHTLGRLFTGVMPWAWLVLGPAAIAGLRRAGRDGAALLMHAVLPALVLSLLYRRIGEHPRGIDVRYLIHLRLLIAVVTGVACAELARRALAFMGRERPGVQPAVAVAIAVVTIAGIGGVFRIPGDGHPGQVIPRANWRAGAAVVRAGLSPNDAILTTSPLAASYFLGRCGTWLRSRTAAAPYVDGGRDVYCGSSIVSSFTDWQAFRAAHRSGWILADAWWHTEVDASVRAYIEARMTRVPSPDQTVLIYRWTA